LLERGDFLAGAEFPQLAALMRWIARQREHWRSAVAQALTERAGALDGADQWSDALALVGRAIEIAPWLEGRMAAPGSAVLPAR